MNDFFCEYHVADTEGIGKAFEKIKEKKSQETNGVIFLTDENTVQ